VLDTALQFDAPKSAGFAKPGNTPDGSEASPTLQAEEGGVQNGDPPLEGAEQPDPVYRDDRPYRPYRLYRDESGAITPESLPPHSMMRFLTVPPPPQDRQALPQERQAIPKANELLPLEKRQLHPFEIAPQTVQGAPG